MKKKVNIVLIIIVLTLWGTVSYRFINKFFSNTDEFKASNISKYNKKRISIVRDTFNFIPLSRDPFLDKLTVSFAKQTKKAYIKRTGNVRKAEPLISNLVWPDIQYKGYIKSGKSAELALIMVNNQLIKLHLGGSSNGITVKKIYKDSISLQYNKQIHVYKYK